MKKYIKGFTLIELLVVIAIIGILASIILVSLNTARQKGKDGRIQDELAQVRTQLESKSNNSNSSYPSLTVTVANIANPGTSDPDLMQLMDDITTLNGGTIGGVNPAATYTIPGSPAATTLSKGAGTGVAGTGVTIYTSSGIGGTVTDFAIYGAQTNGGYFCIDSTGHNKNVQSGVIPTPTANFAYCQ